LQGGNNRRTSIVESSMLRLPLIALTLAVSQLAAQNFGKITGKITDALTGQPIAKVHVGCNVGTEFVGLLSGTDGAYTLEAVPAGEVHMTINLEGYGLISQERDPNANFRLAAGDTMRRNFAMHPLGRIYGRLTDRNSGKGIEGLTVSAGRREYVPGHVYYMGSPGPSARSHGEYELTRLPAGDYRISIDARDEPKLAFTADVATAKPVNRVYGHRLYPDVARPEMAVLVHLGEGESLRLDISLEGHEAHTLSGTVAAPREFEHEPIRFRFHSADSAAGPTGKPMNGPGPFRIENVAPGMYRLEVTAGEPPHEFSAAYWVEIADHDIENFKAALAPEAGVAAEIRMLEEGVKALEFAGINLIPTSDWMTRVGTGGIMISGPAPVRGFAIREGRDREDSIPPDDYWPVVMPLPDGYAVAEIRFEGASARNNVMKLSGPDTPLTIVVTSRPGAVSGLVRNDDQMPVRGALVALLPDPLPDKISPTTIRYAESDDGGTFVFKNVAPGTYRAVVLNGEEDVGRGDASLRERAAKADAIEVRAGQSASINLKR
jgi:Carboxypeptidase regulatory-like domain